MGEDARRPTWLHWALTALCGVFLVILGSSMLIGGAAEGSRFFAIDDALIRVLGAVLILCGPALLFRWDWGFVGAMWVLGMLVIETALTYDVAASGGSPAVVFITSAFLYVLPIPLLSWVRQRVARRRDDGQAA